MNGYVEILRIFSSKHRKKEKKRRKMNTAGGGYDEEVQLLEHVFALTLGVCRFIEVVVAWLGETFICKK